VRLTVFVEERKTGGVVEGAEKVSREIKRSSAAKAALRKEHLRTAEAVFLSEMDFYSLST
jgi:hypothetical protein